QYEASKNAAAQQFQSLQAARARVTLARKAVADTVVRAPFAGLVGERTVAVGDYVTKGTKVATVVRVNPLRVQLTVPEQFVSAVAVQTSGGRSRVYIVAGDHVEERIVTTGERLDSLVEITNGVKPGEQVATANVAQLTDGARVRSGS